MVTAQFPLSVHMRLSVTCICLCPVCSPSVNGQPQALGIPGVPGASGRGTTPTVPSLRRVRVPPSQPEG